VDEVVTADTGHHPTKEDKDKMWDIDHHHLTAAVEKTDTGHDQDHHQK
jgi:hypothetical protein